MLDRKEGREIQRALTGELWRWREAKDMHLLFPLACCMLMPAPVTNKALHV